MTLLSPFALLGLLLLPVLVALHLHRRQARTVVIPSLILWEDLLGEQVRGGKRWQIEQVLLLILQMLAVCALVLFLARPAGSANSAATRVYVIDNGALMAVADPAPSRLDAARAIVARDIESAPPGTTFTIVAAEAQPRVLVSTRDSATAVHQLHQLQPVAATPNLGQALDLAAGLLPTHEAHMLVVYAQGEILPAIAAAPGVLSSTAIGHSSDDQAIVTADVRCAAGAMTCPAFADVRNDAATAIQDDLLIDADGALLGRERLNLPARSDTNLSFAVPATHQVVQLYLTRRDLVASDNLAWSVLHAVTDAPVTVVGDARHTAPLVKAFSAMPNTHVVVRSPTQFETIKNGAPGLLVLAGWLPAGALPAAPSLLLVDPPRLFGEATPSTLSDTIVSGDDPTSPLLQDVDLTSLDIPPGAARHLLLPPGLQAVVWTASGPLIAAGTLEGRRIAVLAFDPAVSNLSQLEAFPVLIDNILRWSTMWLPGELAPGQHLAIDLPPTTTAIKVLQREALSAPPSVVHAALMGTRAYVDLTSTGVYTVTEQGAWGTRSAEIAVNASSGAPENTGGPISIPAATVNTGTPGSVTRTVLGWPGLGLLAALAIAVEGIIFMLRLGRRG